jgi:hypothetical protein
MVAVQNASSATERTYPKCKVCSQDKGATLLQPDDGGRRSAQYQGGADRSEGTAPQ